MIKATKKWIFLKVSGATSVPLMIWFIINFTSIYDQNYANVINFFSNPIEEKISLDNLEWFFFINDLAFLNELNLNISTCSPIGKDSSNVVDK